MSGFDSYTTVQEVSQQPDHYIDVIEKFIDEHKFSTCMGKIHELNPHLSFKFPPGHRIRIIQCIKKLAVKRIVKKRVRKPESKHPKTPKKPKTVYREDSCSDEEENIGVVDNIKWRIGKWAKDTLKNVVKENEDFTISVKRQLGNSKQITASIKCRCGLQFSLQSKHGTWLLSNWTRHYKTKCASVKRCNKQYKTTVENYFSPSATSSAQHCLEEPNLESNAAYSTYSLVNCPTSSSDNVHNSLPPATTNSSPGFNDSPTCLSMRNIEPNKINEHNETELVETNLVFQ